MKPVLTRDVMRMMQSILIMLKDAGGQAELNLTQFTP